MAQAVKIAMPDNVDVDGGYTLQVSAQDTSGNEVAGVNISAMALEVVATGTGTLASGTFAPVLLRQAGG